MIKPQSTTVKVILYKSKTLANGEHPLMLRACTNRIRNYLSLGISCDPKLWDETKSEPKRNHPNKDIISSIISQKVNEYKKRVLQESSEGKQLTAKSLIEKVEKKITAQTFTTFVNEKLEQMKASNQLGNVKVYKTMRNAILDYSKRDIFFSEIDYRFLVGFESHLRERGLSEVSLSNRFRTLKALFNEAILQNVVLKEHYPFDKYKVSKFDLSTRKRAITKAEMMKVFELELPPYSMQSEARHYFLFSYLGQGITFIDIASLQWKNLVNGRIFYKRIKTGKEINFKLSDKALDIIEQYRKTSKNKPEDYIFPILDKDRHKTPVQMDNRIRKVLKRVNRDLKKIAEQAGLDAPLTTYVARHTYATVLKKSGVNISVISEAMGHSNATVTEIYLKELENNDIDQANESLI